MRKYRIIYSNIWYIFNPKNNYWNTQNQKSTLKMAKSLAHHSDLIYIYIYMSIVLILAYIIVECTLIYDLQFQFFFLSVFLWVLFYISLFLFSCYISKHNFNNNNNSEIIRKHSPSFHNIQRKQFILILISKISNFQKFK